jgi:hypothetical protein
MNRELWMYENCPSFTDCRCNDCPLDPLAAIHGGPRFAVDGEEGCKATTATREQISRDHGLLGSWAWLPRERDADVRRRRWENLPDAERQRRAAGLLRGATANASGTHLAVDSNGVPASHGAEQGVDGRGPRHGAESPSDSTHAARTRKAS